MGDSANVAYGRLKEAAHISGYTFARTSEWLETLLADGAWREVGAGFTDVNDFLRSIDLSPFNIGDNRPGLVRRIKELQPDASVRAIADAVGEPKSTIQQDLKPWAPAPPETVQDWTPAPDDGPRDQEKSAETVQDWTPEPKREPEKPGAHVGKNSGDNEWYTPEKFIKSAIAVMGGIDLDPASSDAANDVIGAAQYYTEAHDGLNQPWAGRVWMNPPYAQPLVDRFCTRLAREYKARAVEEACVLINNATETNWFQEILVQASAVCFPRGRIKFWHPNKAATPLQGQAVIYLGRHVAEFKAEFVRHGPVGVFS